MKKMALTATVLALAGRVLAQDAVDIPFQKFVLKNGLTLIVHEDRKAPIVAVNVWYHVGSKNEKTGKTGFAHLFEHLMFNGSENFNDDYFKVLEKIGATDLNGTTNNDRTNYFQNVPTPALDLVLWMESDRMGHLLGAVDQARLDEQRGVVQNEKRQAENEPYGLAYDLIQTNTYPKGHPYSWTTIGSMEDLGAAALDDVKEWFKTYYGAANAILVVAGDVKADEAKAKVEKYFGDIPPGPPIAKHETWIAKRSGTHRQTMQDRVPQARVYKVWNTPEWGSADDTYLDLAARILATAGKTARLYKRLVYDDQIATRVAASQDAGEIGSQFILDASARPGGDLAAVEKAIDEEIQRFLEKGPAADELEAAKTQYLAGFTRGVERIGGFGGKSDVLAENQVYGGSPDAYKKRLQRVREATTQQVWDAAKRWLSDGQYVLTVHPFPELAEDKTGVDRKTAPDAGTAPEPRFPAFQRATLKNGLKLIVAERRAVPVVGFTLLADAGYASDQGGLPGTAKLAADMMDEGTKTRSALDISSALVRLGATLSTGANLDMTSVTLSALKANLDKSLEIFGDVLLNPSFPEKDFERLRRQLLAAIDQESVSPISMALRVMPRLVYGAQHAYGNPLTGSGSKASVAKISRDDVVRWHGTWIRPGSSTLLVVGDTTTAEIVPKLEALFAAWKPGEAPKKNLASVAPKPRSEVYLLDRPGAIQSVIVAGHVAPPKANPNEAAIETMSGVLGTQFISRMNMNLREDKHWSYGAGAFFWDARGQRPFVAYAPVQSDKTKESVAEVLKELRGIRGEKPITADELQAAKNGLTLTLAGQWETAGAVAGSLAEIVRFGFDDRYFDGYAGRIRSLTLQQVQAAGRSAVDADRLVWVVVGDRAKIEAGIRELKLGDIKVVDADGNVVPGDAPEQNR
ncbi:MAG TPA: pitrilysin family protein [Vicinamibacteria bacterium]|nr:pitrilysin family protein [Vicinamibacteria bacterium]